MKKIISFDLDGTLVDGQYGNLVWLEGIPALYAKKYGLPVEEAFVRVKTAYDSIGESHLLWYNIDYWLGKFGLEVSVPDLLDRYCDAIRLLPHVAEAIEALAETHRLVIASNAARVFLEKELSHSGLERYFRPAISATSDFGMVKKEERFYRRLCDVLEASPEEIVHVGDHAVFDVQIPRQIGINAYHYNPAAEANGCVIHDLRQLADRL